MNGPRMIEFDYQNVRSLNHLVGRALTTLDGIKHTYILSKYALKVPGVFVECGVCYGGSAGAMMQAAIDAGDVRDLHLFDSFEGIPMAGPLDDSQPGMASFMVDRNLPLRERLKSSGISAASVDDVRGHFKEWNLPMERVHFHPGWFQDVLPTADVGPIAMLRLDGDLYESIECCMKWLYPRVSRGGIVLSDDWVLNGQDAIRDYFNGSIPDIRVTVDSGAAFWVKP